MSDAQPQDVTRLLAAIESGEAGATERLLPLVYDELRRLARQRMARERPDRVPQPTSLVHEAYLRLVREPDIHWSNRAHFFAASAEAMRRIVIERVRKAGRLRHGGGHAQVPLDDDLAAAPERSDELLALDEALTRLEALDRRMSGIVKLRYFAGLSVDETADALGISPRTVDREWTAARAWLFRELTHERK